MKGHRPIKDYPGYWISWKGHVYSERLEGYLVESLNIKGYLRVTLYNKSGRKWKFLHRLTCEAYKKRPSPHHTQVHHIFFDKYRNGVRCVRWETPEGNYAANKFRMQVIAREAAKKRLREGVVDPF